MKSHLKFLYAAVFMLTAVLLVSEFAAATPRKDLLTKFVVGNQLSGGGFRDAVNSTVIDDLEFSSYASVWILSKTDALSQIANDTNINYFKGRFHTSNQNNLLKMYYSYAGLALLGGTLNSTDITSVLPTFLAKQDPISKGFKNLDDALPTLGATYYAVLLLKAIGQLSSIQASDIINYVNSLWDNNTGAFLSSNVSTAPSPIDSFYAVSTLYEIGQIGNFTTSNRVKLLAYLDSFYCNNTNYPAHIGGYTYSQTYPYSSIYLTFACVKTLKLIGGIEHTATLSWLLARQSSYDYGFQDIKETGDNADSSTTCSYYVVQALLALDSSIMSNQLNQDVWQLSNNPWVVAAIVIGVVGGVVVIIVVIWKLKTRL